MYLNKYLQAGSPITHTPDIAQKAAATYDEFHIGLQRSSVSVSVRGEWLYK